MLRKIRTYDELQISFPEGLILFEGGIGSGKSTLLLAIEFALFGLGNERGTTLLRIGEGEGEVEMTFEVAGCRYTIHRSLVRTVRRGARSGVLITGGVRQGDTWIEHGGRRERLSPKEMKERVLQILGYNEPVDPKAKSIIFRYAVYTPQEEMKEILSQSVDRRLETIRKALRLEEYKTARDNACYVAGELKRRALFLREGERDLPAIEEELRRLGGKISGLMGEASGVRGELGRVEAEISSKKLDRERLRQKIDAIAGEAERSEEISRCLEDIIRRIAVLKGSITDNKERIAAIRARMGEALHWRGGDGAGLEGLSGRLRAARERLEESAKNAGAAGQRSASYAQAGGGTCPLCNQPVNPEEFGRLAEAARRAYLEAEAERGEAKREVERLERARESAACYRKASESASILQERLEDLETQIRRDEGELERAESRRRDLEEDLQRSDKLASEHRQMRDKAESIGRDLERQEERRRELLVTLAGKEGDIRVLGMNISNLQRDKEAIEREGERGADFMDYADWLSNYFAEALSRIEVTVLAAAKREFHEEFCRWFAYLVEDPAKSVAVDENFTPLVAQDSYEQEVANLSGGERTALALAYRLALNRVVQRNAGLTSSLLLLDEPTDGFSKEQIGRLGDLLKELDLRQAIIVSHERELEGAVDHIFRVEKENGRSRLLQVS